MWCFRRFPVAMAVFAMVVSLALAWAGYLCAVGVMPAAGVLLAVRGVVLNWGAYAKVEDNERRPAAVRRSALVSSPVRVVTTPYRVVGASV